MIKWTDKNKKLRAAAYDYAMAIVQACDEKKVTNTLHALTDTDCYPRLQKVPEVEFAIGWLHGVAESANLSIESLWIQLMEETNEGRGRQVRATRKAKAA